jgi:hypothetical protein
MLSQQARAGSLQFFVGEQWLPGEPTMFERYAAYLAIVILIWITAKQFLPAAPKQET